MSFRRAFAAWVPIALAACGGNVQLGVSDASVHDSAVDAASDGAPTDSGGGDAACVNPVQGTPCTTSEVACTMPGDPCCIGYVWACIGGPSGASVWTQEGLGCACRADAATDVATDDGGHVDANPSACPSTWAAASTGDHDSLCAAAIACDYAEGSCTCEPFCGGIPVPDADTSPRWACTPNRTDGCATPTPKDGDPCTIAGQQCTYGSCCVTTFTCASGAWKAGPMECPG